MNNIIEQIDSIITRLLITTSNGTDLNLINQLNRIRESLIIESKTKNDKIVQFKEQLAIDIYEKHWRSWIEKQYGKETENESDFSEVQHKYIIDAMEEYAENKQKLNLKEIENLKNEITAYEVTVQNLRLQLTDKDILLDQKIGKLNSIRQLVENI